MDMRSVQHEVVAREWQKRILEQRSSGMNVRKWCADNNVRENRYYYWLRALRNEELALSKTNGIFTELRLRNSGAAIDEPTSGGICAVIRGPSLCLEIHNGADQTTLEMTIRALGVLR
jgi:hypothetical protein